MSVDERVRAHFDTDAGRFDNIYSTDKNLFSRFVDNFWRGVVQRRLEINIQRLQPLHGKSVLDVGCGSGRFCIAYALQGAARAVGIDFASVMIEMAREAAGRNGVGDRCEFLTGSFLQMAADEVFDASTANGLFDYVDDPVPIIRKMREMTRETMIMSFPKAIEWRIPVRWIRFQLNGCPLYLYTRRRVLEILAEAGIADFESIDFDRDFLIVAHLSSTRLQDARR